MKNPKPVLVFVIGSIALTWAFAVGCAATVGHPTPLQSRIVIWISMLIPGIVALAVNKFIMHRKWFSGLGFSAKFSDSWYAALYVPFGIALLSTLVGLLLPDISFGAKVNAQVFFILLFQWAFGGLSIFGLLGLAEQLGWRGLLYGEFSESGFWKASLVIGVFWGICRAPVTIHGEFATLHGVLAMLMTVCWCTLLSPIIQLLRIKTGSILPVAVFIGMLSPNTLFQLPFVFTYGYSRNTLYAGVNGVAGLLVLLVIDLLLLVYFRRKPEYFAIA